MVSVRLAIVGTRVLACENDDLRADARIQRAIRKLWPDEIISGGAAGIDSIAESVAVAYGYTEGHGLIVHRPRVKQFHGPGGYRERDLLIAWQCTHLLRLACRQATTYGSGWTADQAAGMGKIVVNELVCPPA